MTDFEKECDATMEAARRNVAEGERLAEQCDAAFRAKVEWEQANGIDAAKRERFFNGLSPEDRKKIDEENERFNRETAHDLERAIDSRTPQKPGGGKRRNYM